MLNHEVRTHRSADDFPITEHLAYKIAQVAADPVAVAPDTEAMVICIDTPCGEVFLNIAMHYMRRRRKERDAVAVD